MKIHPQGVFSHRVRQFYRYRVLKLRALTMSYFQKKGWRTYAQLSDDDTLDFLSKNRVGIVRFGNSELSYVAGTSRRNQDPDELLRAKLVDILKSHAKCRSYKVGLPLDATILAESSQRVVTRSIWDSTPKLVVQAFAKSNYVYLSPFVFRLKNVVTPDKGEYVSRLSRLFDGKDIIYVGPLAGRNSEIWEKIKIKEAVSIPEQNAFSLFEEIKQDVITKSHNYSNPLVLIVGGITATALSAELNESGILTYDLGQMSRHIKQIMDQS